MRTRWYFIIGKRSYFLTLVCILFGKTLFAQQTQITDYVIFGGKQAQGQTAPAAPGYGVQLGSSTNIQGGLIGSYYLFKTTGNGTFGTNIFSGGIIQLANSNVVNGRLAARNDSSLGGTIISVGSSTNISGNIDAKGNIVVVGGTVSGRVTHPFGTTYSGPVPGGGDSIGTPNLPTLPVMPVIRTFSDTLPGSPNITNTQTIYPAGVNGSTGIFGNVFLGGNKTLTLKGPGVYVFKSIKNTGTSNNFVFDFNNNPNDTFKIYVWGDVDLGKVKASIIGGNPTRIYFEIHGKGTTSASGKVAFNIANGSSGSASKWLGAVWAPFAAINVGSGTGSTDITGALWSGTQVNIQSGVTMNLYCNPPTVNAGPDKPLDFSTKTKLVATPFTPGVTFSWQALNGGIIDPTYFSPNNDTIKVLVAGTYIVTASQGPICSAKDTVVVTGRLRSIIGSELQSVYDNNTTDTTFFFIQNGYVLIDIIAKAGFRDSVTRLLMNNLTLYGLRDTIPNGTSNFFITGFFPVPHLPNLNSLAAIINYCRPHYQGHNNSGLVHSAGDTTIRSYLVRKGYTINGDGIKIGVISDSYATITAGTTATLPYQPVTSPPNPIPQTFNTNTAAQDVANGDLPGDTTFAVGGHVVNPNGFTKNVHVLQDFPIRRTDEGRGMLQIIHDVAPGAELYFRTGFFTAGDFAAGIHQLKNAGCKIIVDDMTYITEPFLKDGVVAKAVDSVAGQGVAYFSAAGNFAGKSYEKDFLAATVPSGPFAGKKAHNFGGGDMFQQLRLAPGAYIFVLQWLDNIYSSGETSGTLYDMDFYLTPNTDGTSLFGFNRDNLLGDPIEFIPFTVPGLDIPGADSMNVNLFIVNNTTTGNPARIKYIVFRGGVRIMEFVEGRSTIIGQANAAGAMTVGAARFDKAPPYLSPPLLEAFSSTGGTKTNGVIRNKPDFVAPDGVNTTVLLGQDYPNSALDGYSNFFGTSAAAPHAAAVAALIMEGKKKFLNQPVTTPSEVRSLLQSKAIDMGTPGFDFTSGYGLINIDLVMRTFAAPTPFIRELVVPVTNPPTIPGNSVFTVTVKGENFSTHSIIYFRDSALASTIVLDTVNGIATAVIPTFDDNPPIRVYTPPISISGLDGGFSNIKRFFEAAIIIRVDTLTKQYGQQLPTLTAKVFINGVRLEDTTVTLSDLGLDVMTLTTPATANSDVGNYVIIVSRTFDAAIPADSALLSKYNYEFINGRLTIQKLPVKVVPDDKTVTYGQAIGNISFKYYYENGTLITDPFLLNKLDSSHKRYLADNILAVISGYPGSPALTDDSLQNMSGMVSFQAVKNSRKFQLVDGELVPLPANSTTFNVQYLVDVSAQSIRNYRSNPSLAIFEPAYPGVHSRAMVSAGSLFTGNAHVEVNGTLVPMVNGTLVPMVNGLSGTLAPVLNGTLVQMVNGTLANGTLVQMVNGVLVQLVNGELVQLANGVLVQLVNGTLVQMVNGVLVQVVNGANQPVLNGTLVQVVNGVLVQVVNGVNVPVANGTLVQMVNGTLVQLVNGTLVQMVNGTLVPIINGLVQIVNGVLVQLVNGTYYELLNGTLVPLVNGTLVQLVNSYSIAPGDNENAAVIIDTDDTAVQHSSLGAMFSTNMITGLDVGQQTLISGMLVNNNFSPTYGLGTVTINPDPCLLTHSPFKNFGNTSNLPAPTSLWLNLATKVSGQLSSPGDYLLFKSATVTFNFISSTPLVNNLPMPNGKIMAVTAVTGVTYPRTYFEVASNTWITEVLVNFASTSDIFVTGAIINSDSGFVKLNGNTSSVVKGKFFSNKYFNDQWGYAIAAYQKPPSYNFVTYSEIGAPGQVASINGTYRAGTPIPIIPYLVNGGSGGGGNNYTGSSSSFQNYTACIAAGSPSQISNTSLVQPETQAIPLEEELVIMPNPASDNITLSFVPSFSGNSKIILLTIDGRKVIEIDNSLYEAGKKYIKQIDVSKLNSGVYMIQLWNANKITVKKFIIAR